MDLLRSAIVRSSSIEGFNFSKENYPAYLKNFYEAYFQMLKKGAYKKDLNFSSVNKKDYDKAFEDLKAYAEKNYGGLAKVVSNFYEMIYDDKYLEKY